VDSSGLGEALALFSFSFHAFLQIFFLPSFVCFFIIWAGNVARMGRR